MWLVGAPRGRGTAAVGHVVCVLRACGGPRGRRVASGRDSHVSRVRCPVSRLPFSHLGFARVRTAVVLLTFC